MPSEFKTLVQCLGPIVGRAIRSGQLFKPSCKLTEPNPDILCEFDVVVPVSDGIKLTANIFRSKLSAQRGKKVPVVMCAHPYNNHHIPVLNGTPLKGPPQQYRIIPQAGTPEFSALTSWESPDPNFWIPSGYAVVNLNLPGYANSEGMPSVFSDHQAKCYYEAIEWIAAQSWCTGNVGLNGVSFLAITQYHVAACQAYGGPPPSLKCISPWEGLSDMYRDVFCPGGVTEIGFPTFWWKTEVIKSINGTKDDFVQQEGAIPTEYLQQHPTFDEFWVEKAAKVDEIDLPMLVCGSFSDHGLHTCGSLRAFEKAKSKHKWLYTHRYGKWDVYYSKEVQALTKQFMDCFLKGQTDNGFLDRPAVRLEVRKSREEIHQVRNENEWPLARTKYKRLYIRPANAVLSCEPESYEGTIAYSSDKDHITLALDFEKAIEIIGYMKLKLWVSIPENAVSKQADDISLFVAVDKLDKRGNPVKFYGSVGSKQDSLSRGCIKVSHRALDREKSTDWLPLLTHKSIEKITAGQVVPVEISLYPHATYFEQGEGLRLTLSSKDIISNPPYKKLSEGSDNWLIHCGGMYDSYLQVPVLPVLLD